MPETIEEMSLKIKQRINQGIENQKRINKVLSG